MSKYFDSNPDEWAMNYYNPKYSIEDCRNKVPYTYITSGSSRDIFQTPYGILKIINNKNTKQNKIEISIWEDANKNQREYLADVKEYSDGFHWLLMKEVPINGDGYENAKDKHYDIIHDIGYTCVELEVADNGIIFDYGHCYKI